MGMVAGAPFPDLYDWTWGELREYIDCRNEAEKDKLRTDAAMYFRTAVTLTKMVAGTSGQPVKMMDEYSFLWTQQERDKMKEDRLKQFLFSHSKNVNNGTGTA